MPVSKADDRFSRQERKLVAEIRALKSQLARYEESQALMSSHTIEDMARFPAENPSPVFRIDSDGTLLYANQACETLLADLDKRTGQAFPEEWLDLVRSVSSTKPSEGVELQHGDRFFSFKAVPVSNTTYVNVYGTDITEYKAIEAEQRLILDLLHVLNRPADLRSALQDVTMILQQWSGCEAVGVRLREGCDFPYFVTQGFGAEFVQLENFLCAVDQAGELICDSQGGPVVECMCGNVICGRFNPSLPFFTTQGSFWTNCTTDLLASTDETDRQAHTRNRCNGQDKPLRTDVQAMLFRSVRELLANTVKHSSARTVEVHISRDADEIIITVKDNGIGFTPDDIVINKESGGYGLFSIRERLDQLGGRLDIHSSSGQGCKNILRAPLLQTS